MKGNVEWRNKAKGQALLVVNAGMDADNKRIRYTRGYTCKTKKESDREKEADRALVKFIEEIESGQYIKERLTLKEFVTKWLKTHGEKNLAPKTLFRYTEVLESRVIPALGHLYLDKIRPLHLQDFYDNLTEDGIRKDKQKGGLSAKTIMVHHRILHRLFNDAIKWQFMVYNPADRVTPPKIKRTPALCYDEDQITALLKALDQLPPDEFKYKVFVILGLTSGCRRGEIAGLTWQKVDWEKNEIYIDRSLQYVPGAGVSEKDPKTQESVRPISLPQSVMTLLKEYKAYQRQELFKLGKKLQDTDPLFTALINKEIKHMHPDTISKWFNKFLADSKLPHIPFHSLRHTSISLLIDSGLNPRAVSARAGHSNTSTTLNIYSHKFKKADQKAAEAFEGLFNGKKEGVTANTSV